MQAVFRDDVDLPSEKGAQLSLKMELIKEVSPLPKSDQQVQIALSARLAAAYRAKDTHMTRTVAAGDSQKLVSVATHDLLDPQAGRWAKFCAEFGSVPQGRFAAGTYSNHGLRRTPGIGASVAPKDRNLHDLHGPFEFSGGVGSP